jgi:hypothetical protein
MFKLPNKPYHVIQKFLVENRPTVFRYLIKKIKFAIDNDISNIELFELPSRSNSRHVAVIKEPDFEKVLNQAIESFSEVEDYEAAAKAQNLIRIYRDKYITKLLNDISNEE